MRSLSTKKGKERVLDLPLSSEEFEILKSHEREVYKTYHMEDWKGLIVLHNDGHEFLQKVERFHEARSGGYDLLDVPVSQGDLTNMEEDGALVCYYPSVPPIHLRVMKVETYEKAHREILR